MLNWIRRLRNKPEWWEEEFLLGNPYSEKQWDQVLNPHTGSHFYKWDQSEVEKRKNELRLKREVTPVELPVLSLDSLDESMNIKEWYKTFNEKGFL